MTASMRLQRERQVLEYVAANPGVSAKEIRDYSGCPRRTLHGILTGLAERGQIIGVTSLKDCRCSKYYAAGRDETGALVLPRIVMGTRNIGTVAKGIRGVVSE